MSAEHWVAGGLLVTGVAVQLAACLGLLGFVSFLTFFKGEPCWGPRYLTPAFALLWVFVPSSLERVGQLSGQRRGLSRGPGRAVEPLLERAAGDVFQLEVRSFVVVARGVRA